VSNVFHERSKYLFKRNSSKRKKSARAMMKAMGKKSEIELVGTGGHRPSQKHSHLSSRGC
jgi:hypothetical protein